jgi:hypothetical protein
MRGYHRWRRNLSPGRVCTTSRRFGFGGRRRASGRGMQQHFYHVSFGVLIVSLCSGWSATNGDVTRCCLHRRALAPRAPHRLILSGKTWCNYVCPNRFVEKIYTEPRSLRPNGELAMREMQRRASRPCPDINQENTYWKEVLLPAKRHVYFAFPGLVFTFYFYLFPAGRDWEY